MQLVVGGAYSGKRKWVKEKFPDSPWISAYENAQLTNWKQTYESGSSPLITEGWEEWIRQEWDKSGELDVVTEYFEAIIDEMQRVEEQRKQSIVMIMLEMGRGVVPIDKDERAWRDLSGWVLQSAAARAESVHYCWHGLSRKLK